MNVVVTGGGTVAPIDDVRQIANISTGRFAASITEACLTRGATVWHIHAPSAVVPFCREAVFDLDCPDPQFEFTRLERLRERWREVRSRLHLVRLTEGTVEDYRAALKRTLRSQRIDVVFLAMAVGDFEPEPHSGKLETPTSSFTMSCRPTPKVIRSRRQYEKPSAVRRRKEKVARFSAMLAARHADD